MFAFGEVIVKKSACGTVLVAWKSPHCRNATSYVRLLPSAAERQTMLSYARSTGESLAEQTERKAEVAFQRANLAKFKSQKDE